jgi:transposase
VGRERTETSIEAMQARLAALEAALASEREQRIAAEGERDRALAAYRAVQTELELLRRRIFAAKAERVDTTQLELEFAQKLSRLDALEGALGTSEPEPRTPKSRPRPTGRRDLAQSSLPVERIEITDAVMESLVEAGRAEKIGVEESSRLAYRRGGFVRVALARTKYRTLPGHELEASVVTAPLPAEILPRSIATPSLLARIASDKHTDALPLYRQEERAEREGVPIDRGSMSRWLEEVGNLCGATVVEAMRREALGSAFCIATDATGVLVQPIRTHEKAARQACRRGHFFVQIADRDHVFFEYVERETSAAVHRLFRGFTGYVQADAKSVYDLLFREPGAGDEAEPDGASRVEVGCWAHARRYFYEAAITKSPLAREALCRIHRLFENEEAWAKESPSRRRELRDRHSRPLVADFFEWAEARHLEVEGERGLVRSAFGYVVRQRSALERFLDDGRLPLDNNRSERELRRVAIGRKNWLFVGSDDHAQAAAALLSLVASTKLHGLDPESYLRDLFRVLPHWPADRYLELAPRYWSRTRDRLDQAELARELGLLTVPPAVEQDAAR